MNTFIRQNTGSKDTQRQILTTNFTMKRNAWSLIYVNWTGGRCTAGRGRATAAIVPPTTPRRAKTVTPVNIKVSVARRSAPADDGTHMSSLLAAVAAPHAPPLGEGRPSSRQQQQGRTGLAPGRR